MPARVEDRFEVGEAILEEQQPIPRFRGDGRACGDRGGITVDADHPRARRCQDGARVAAGAEGRVDVDAASADTEPPHRGAGEHGKVTSRSASDSRAVAARHHSRAPSGFAPAIRAPSSCL